MAEDQKEKRKNSSRNPYLLIAGVVLIIIGAIVAFLIIGTRPSETIATDCLTQTGYQMAIMDGRDVLISNPETGVFEKPMVNLSRLNIVDMFWSPDGHYITLLASEENPEIYDVYVFDPTGGRLRNLTGGNYEIEPNGSVAWSPDGKTLAILSWGRKNPDVMTYLLLNPQSGDIVWSLESAAMFNTSYGNLWQWSPDGSKLALILNQEGFYNLHVYDVASDSLAPIAQPVGKVPDWSPDSSQLLLVEPQFQIVDALTGNTVQSFQDMVSTQPPEAKWSPDGSQIIYSDKQQYQIISLDGTQIQSVMASPSSSMVVPINDVSWSPDGRYIASSIQINDSTFSISMTDGTGVYSVGEPSAYALGWSADSEWVLYLKQMDKDIPLFLVAADGSHKIALSPNSGVFKWSPDHQFIALRDVEALRIFHVPDETGCLANPRVSLISWNPIAVDS